MSVSDPSVQVDHIDHDGLNCQKYNLRVGTNTHNQGNRRKTTKPMSSKFKGVSWDKSRGKWRASIGVKCEVKQLGRFDSEEEAARVYDKAAREYFAEFAFPNISE